LFSIVYHFNFVIVFARLNCRCGSIDAPCYGSHSQSSSSPWRLIGLSRFVSAMSRSLNFTTATCVGWHRIVGAHSYDVRISICPVIAIGLTRKWRTQINIPHPSVSPRSTVCLNSDSNPDCAIKVDHGLPTLHDWAATAKRRVYGLPSPRRRMHKDRRLTPRRTIKCSAQFSSAFRNANACHD